MYAQCQLIFFMNSLWPYTKRFRRQLNSMMRKFLILVIICEGGLFVSLNKVYHTRKYLPKI